MSKETAVTGSAGLEVFVLTGIGEVGPGDDLAALILDAAAIGGRGGAVGAGAEAPAIGASARGAITGVSAGTVLRDGDILAVTSKIVSKSEGRIVAAADRERAITDETVRVVASRVTPDGITRIVENRQGLVMAAAGVDASNTADGTVLLLPLDPNASARALCYSLRVSTGLRLGVIITDTAGRPWREGQTDIAIGSAGVVVLDDLRGTTDAFGRHLDVTAAAAGDEIAGAADLVKGKTSQNPVAVVRGLARLVVADATMGGRDARVLQRSSEKDMFRLGSTEAHAEGYAAGFEAGLSQGQAAGFAAGLAAARAGTRLGSDARAPGVGGAGGAGDSADGGDARHARPARSAPDAPGDGAAPESGDTPA